jgi:hypothetical protein
MAKKVTNKKVSLPISLMVKFNGFEEEKRTDNIDEAILSFKPEMLMTEMYITAKKGEMVSERKLTLVQGRKLFNNESFRQIFINNLLLN